MRSLFLYSALWNSALKPFLLHCRGLKWNFQGPWLSELLWKETDKHKKHFSCLFVRVWSSLVNQEKINKTFTGLFILTTESLEDRILLPTPKPFRNMFVSVLKSSESLKRNTCLLTQWMSSFPKIMVVLLNILFLTRFIFRRFASTSLIHSNKLL